MAVAKARPFESELVIEERISTPALRAYHVGYDQNKFRLEPLVDLLESVIPEFALGLHVPSVPARKLISVTREAAKTVYTTSKYKRRGEFGELVLHLLLRDFCGTIPLVSKIYFKDSDNVAAHGFDGVQVTENGTDLKLWLGESKFYHTGEAGVTDLLGDLKKHLKSDYLRREFALISKKIPAQFPKRNHWVQLMHKHNKLDKIFKSVVIPMVCTYTSDTIKNHKKETQQYIDDFMLECNKLGQSFEGRRPKTICEVVLILLPVHDKDKLATQLHSRLMGLQGKAVK